jgi:hypothetical protein
MSKLKLPALAGLGVIAMLVSCAKPAEQKTETKTESTTTNPDGRETEVKRETTQMAGTSEQKTETKTDTADGTVKAKTETYVGTVSKYEPGKKIEVTTLDNKTHSFDLNDKDVTTNIDPSVKVGQKVQLTEAKGDNRQKTITIRPEA